MLSNENTINIKIDQGFTLNKMLGNKNYIEVPIIQRDYAQGRENAKEIREDFLKDIFDHLDAGERLKLNFVYGTTRTTPSDTIYIPYDGQQRITLIYLLTLYFAAFCGEWDELKRISRFKYYTRDYATEFCSFLTGFSKINDNKKYDNVFKRINFSMPKLKTQLMDDIEFFGAWENDPTTASMLVVLDDIHSEFINRNSSLDYNDKQIKAKKLLQELSNGILFFDWCSINADDNIYIKMNGRGKPLSAFDNFKNTLYSELNKLRNRDALLGRTDRINFLRDFEIKMDGVWTDLFWSPRDSLSLDDKNIIAPAMMNCLFFVLELRSAVVSNSFYFGSRLPFTWIDEKNVVSFLSIFKERCNLSEGSKAVTLDDFIWLSKFLDVMNFRLTNPGIDILTNEIDGFENELELFDDISTSKKRKENVTRYILSAQTSIIAAMYYEYLIRVSSFDNYGQFLSCNDTNKTDWLKLIGRLMKTIGHYKARFDSLQREKHIIYGYSNHFVSTAFRVSSAGSLLEASSEFDENAFIKLRQYFDYSHAYSQLYEEILKLKLIKIDQTKWKTRLEAAERGLSYFDNQIYFLIRISTDDNGNVDEQLFDRYLSVVQSITDSNGILTCYQNRFSSILLSYGDYRVKSTEGFTNTYGLCSNNSNDCFEWRYFFDLIVGDTETKCSVMKKAFELIHQKGSLEAAYESVKSNSTSDRWRDIIIKYPEILEHGNKHRLVHEDENGYWFLIKSNGVSKQVHTTSLVDSTNIYLYGIYRACGNDDANDIAIGYSLAIDSNHKIVCNQENHIGLFDVQDKNNNLLGTFDYDETIRFVLNDYVT